MTNVNSNYLKSKTSPNFKGTKPNNEDNMGKRLDEFNRNIKDLKSLLTELKLKKKFCDYLGDKSGAEQCTELITKIEQEISAFL